MRVIAGKARRLQLKTLPGLETRPTADRIKETLFNIINPDVEGCTFLDLFSGSGGIGIEALSRGARIAVFVDNNKKAIECIKENLNTTNLLAQSEVVLSDVLALKKRTAFRKYKFDIVYIDPPYRAGIEEEVLKMLDSTGVIDEDSLIIIEADKKNMLDFITSSAFEIIREKEYKTNKHYFLKLKSCLKEAE